MWETLESMFAVVVADAWISNAAEGQMFICDVHDYIVDASATEWNVSCELLFFVWVIAE